MARTASQKKLVLCRHHTVTCTTLAEAQGVFTGVVSAAAITLFQFGLWPGQHESKQPDGTLSWDTSGAVAIRQKNTKML